MKKLFKITALLVGGEASDDIDVCVCESKELAHQIVNNLTAINGSTIDNWNKYGCKCEVSQEAWDSPDRIEVKETLERCKNFDCPYKKNIRISEPIGDDNLVEIVCDGQTNFCRSPYEYTFMISEIDLCDKIEDVEFYS